MAQFVSYSKTIKVKREVVLAYINSYNNKEIAKQILQSMNIEGYEDQEWLLLQDFLDALKYINDIHGFAMLFRFGQSIAENIEFPESNNIFELFDVLDKTYYANHQGNMIGHYAVVDKNSNSITLQCDNPYPCEMDKGVILGLAKKHKPNATLTELKDIKGCRQEGSDNCTYQINWV